NMIAPQSETGSKSIDAPRPIDRFMKWVFLVSVAIPIAVMVILLLIAFTGIEVHGDTTFPVGESDEGNGKNPARGDLFYRRAADNLESYVRSRGFNRITREPKTGVIHSVLSTQHPAWFEMVDGTPIWICIVRGDDTTIKVHKWVSTGNEVL